MSMDADVKLPESYREMIDGLKAIPGTHGPKRKAYTDSLPREFWQALADHTDGFIGAVVGLTGISKEVIARHYKQHGIKWNHTHRTSADAHAWKERQAMLESHKRLVKRLIYTYKPKELAPKIGRVIFADIHFPTFSPLWVNRGLGVAEHFGYRSAVVIGDTANFDAVSKFAELDKGKPKPIQEMMLKFEAFLLSLNRYFDDISFLVGNHELRLLRLLEGHFDAEYLFGKLLRQKFVDADHIFIGPGGKGKGGIRLVHRWRGAGRKVMMSEPAELASACGQDVYVAHSHRYGHIWSNHSYRAGMLGGMVAEEELEYRTKHTDYINWQNGFFVYHPKPWRDGDGQRRFGLMQGFADGETDWREYGCE